MLVISMENVDGLVKSLDDMTKQLDAIPQEMYVELDEWQTDDVHFRRPYTKMVDDHTVETLIWPRHHRRPKARHHSRARGRKSMRLTHKQAKAIAQKRVQSRARAISSQRPLLREFLFEKLIDRMNTLLENVSWQ